MPAGSPTHLTDHHFPPSPSPRAAQVYDARAALRPLFSLPGLSPSLVAWHPVYPTTLLMGSGSGLFSILDVSNPATTASYQVGGWVGVERVGRAGGFFWGGMNAW